MALNSATLLEFRDVSFLWPGSKTPLWSHLSFVLCAGEGRYLDTPSGSGKSTLLKLAAGLLHPTTGEIIRSTDRIGMAFQDQRLLPWLTPRQNLRLTMASPDDTKIDAMLDILELSPIADSPADTLSGGEAQRVNLLRALMAEPALLLLDEPFTGLDERMTQKCTALLQEWHASGPDRAFLLVTHLPEIAGLCHATPLLPA